MPTDDVASDAIVVLDKKFARAVEDACSLHRTQTRKGTNVPYAAHLLGVASLVLEGGGTQREAIAALFHDSLEDTSTTPKQIELARTLNFPHSRAAVIVRPNMPALAAA